LDARRERVWPLGDVIRILQRKAAVN